MNELPNERLHELYRQMLLIRFFEEKVDEGPVVFVRKGRTVIRMTIVPPETERSEKKPEEYDPLPKKESEVKAEPKEEPEEPKEEPEENQDLMFTIESKLRNYHQSKEHLFVVLKQAGKDAPVKKLEQFLEKVREGVIEEL